MQEINLFIGAHLDDIEIGCGGILADYFFKKSEVLKNSYFVILSSGRELNDISISEKRLKAFEINMEKLNIPESRYFVNNSRIDTEFFDHKINIKQYLLSILKKIQKRYEEKNPDNCELFNLNVYFNSSDNHEDHRITNELIKEIIRPFSNLNCFKVNSLIEYEIPSSNLYGSPGDHFCIYKTIENKQLEFKKELLDSYKNISLFSTQDARDPKYIINWNKIQGEKIGDVPVERFNLIFKRL